MCIVWLAAYGLLWMSGVWRPLPSAAWVNFAIIGAILMGTLPPVRVRNLTAAAGYLAIGVIMQVVIHNTPAALVLVVLGAIALANGIACLRSPSV